MEITNGMGLGRRRHSAFIEASFRPKAGDIDLVVHMEVFDRPLQYMLTIEMQRV